MSTASRDLSSSPASAARPDPLLDDIRAVKQRISAAAGHDVRALCRTLQEEQGNLSDRLVDRRAGSGGLTVWRLTAHHRVPQDAARWMQQSGLIALGWGAIGDIAKTFRSAEQIAQAVAKDYPDAHNAASGGASLFSLCFRMKIGDLVIVTAESDRVAVMQVTGDYEFKAAPEPAPIGEYQHQRRARAIDIDPDALWHEAGAGTATGQSIYWPLIQCRRPIHLQARNRQLR